MPQVECGLMSQAGQAGVVPGEPSGASPHSLRTTSHGRPRHSEPCYRHTWNPYEPRSPHSYYPGQAATSPPRWERDREQPRSPQVAELSQLWSSQLHPHAAPACYLQAWAPGSLRAFVRALLRRDPKGATSCPLCSLLGKSHETIESGLPSGKVPQILSWFLVAKMHCGSFWKGSHWLHGMGWDGIVTEPQLSKPPVFLSHSLWGKYCKKRRLEPLVPLFCQVRLTSEKGLPDNYRESYMVVIQQSWRWGFRADFDSLKLIRSSVTVTKWSWDQHCAY